MSNRISNRIFWGAVWAVLILGLWITLTEAGYLPRIGRTRTTTEVYYQTGDGRESVIRSEDSK